MFYRHVLALLKAELVEAVRSKGVLCDIGFVIEQMFTDAHTRILALFNLSEVKIGPIHAMARFFFLQGAWSMS